MTNNFFETINYSSCNEDPATELEALQIGAADRVACITGSGDRPLHMLLGDAEYVYAIDLNRIQNYLLQLKIAAIKELSYSDYIGFLGIDNSMGKGGRCEIYVKLRLLLSAGCVEWFDSHKKIIEQGVLYSGRWENYFRLSSRCIRLWRGKKIEQLFHFTDLEAQRDFVRKEWDTILWRMFLKISFNRFCFKWLFGDPGFYTQVRKDFSPSQYINRKMNSYLQNHLANESFMLALIFFGRFISTNHYPPYLKRENFQLLKSRVDRISIHTVSLDYFLASELAERCNKFSLSDVSSFLDDISYKQLIKYLASRPNCRFCLRNFLTNREVPEEFLTDMKLFPGLQEELSQKDRSIGYSFIVGETV